MHAYKILHSLIAEVSHVELVAHALAQRAERVLVSAVLQLHDVRPITRLVSESNLLQR